MDHPESDPLDLLREMDDPEMRARTARQWCLAFDEDRLIDGLSLGDGPEARLNRGAFDAAGPTKRQRRKSAPQPCCPYCQRAL